MTTVRRGLDRVTQSALVVYGEWLGSIGEPPAQEDEDFCRDFVRAIFGDTLDWAAEWMRSEGPTIAAIQLEEATREVRMAARAA